MGRVHVYASKLQIRVGDVQVLFMLIVYYTVFSDNL